MVFLSSKLGALENMLHVSFQSLTVCRQRASRPAQRRVRNPRILTQSPVLYTCKTQDNNCPGNYDLPGECQNQVQAG